jgi:predicted NBD/HSP70 family sugar kinase
VTRSAPAAALRPNQQRLLAVLGRHDRLRRSELALLLDLPKATVAGLVDDLLARGLVIENTPESGSGAGRPARSVSLAGRPPAAGVLVWSTDLLRVAVASLTGRILAERTVPMAPQEEIDGLLDPGLRLLRAAARDADLRIGDLATVVLGVPTPFQRGVGMPVPASPPGGRGHYVGWLRADPATELSKRAGTQATVENDANLGALGEYTFGAGQGLDSLVYLKLGNRSMGAGLIINGRLHRGVTGFAGELAHIQVHNDGVLCVCGGRGCLIHDVGPGLARLVEPAYDGPISFDQMLDLAEQGDPGLRRILGDLGRTIGRPLADLCSMLNPAAIVVDGVLGPAGGYIIEGIREAVTRHAAPTAADAVRILPGTLGAHADLLGAVALARDDQHLPVF